MNPEQPTRDEIESRLTALLLGELPDDEARLLRWTIAQDPKLAKLRDQLELTIGLVRQVAANPVAEAAKSAPLKFSDERRQKLLAHFQTPRAVAALPPIPREQSWFGSKLVTALALVAVIAVLAAMLLPSLAAAKRKAQSVTLLSAKRMAEAEDKPFSPGVSAISPATPMPMDTSLAPEPVAAPTPTVSPPVVAQNQPGQDLQGGTKTEIVLPKADSTPEIAQNDMATSSTYANSTVAYSTAAAGTSAMEEAKLPAPANPQVPATPTVALAAGGVIENGDSFYRAGNKPTTDPQMRMERVEKQWIQPKPQPSQLPTASPAPDQTIAGGDFALVESERAGENGSVQNHAVVGTINAFAGGGGGGGGGGYASRAIKGLAADSRLAGENIAGSIPSSPPLAVDDSSTDRLRTENQPANDGQKLRRVGVPENTGDKAGFQFNLGNGSAAATTQPKENFPVATGGDKLAWNNNADGNWELANNRSDLNGTGKLAVSQKDTDELPVLLGDLRETSQLSSAGQFSADAPAVKTTPNSTRSRFVSRKAYLGEPADSVEVPKELPPSDNSTLTVVNGINTYSGGTSDIGGTLARNDQKSTGEAQSAAVEMPNTTFKQHLLQATNAVVAAVDGSSISLAVDEDRIAAKTASSAPIPLPEILTRENAFSTFSLNVSDVSFKLAAASLENGRMPDASSIRSEEFINAFDYRDPAAAAGQPVAFASERARDPFAQNRDLLRFSIKTAAAGRAADRPLNLALLLDTSGSMERADRVAIIREAMRVLTTQLHPQDVVSVVTFARTARLWADGVAGDKAGETLSQVGGITPEGGTNLEEAMRLAYETARRHYLANGINRVVLLTDGAANLGNVNAAALKQKVEAQRKQGIALDCFGIGWEDFNDDMLAELSGNGDGRYAFINSPEEAGTEFAAKLAGALQVAAQDVKVQVEFNPQRVISWRQIGYAKHQLTKEQFRDNSVIAAEISAQEAGNALYTVETKPDGTGPVATVYVRYKIPGTEDVQEHEWEVPYDGNAPALGQSSAAMRLAATAGAFSEWLAASPFAQEVSPDELLKDLSGVPQIYGADQRPKKLEWMIRQAKSLSGK
jgi:Mg-chelatase subunit ChlD